MTDLPFGFSSSDGRDDDDKERARRESGAGGFGGFDPSMFGGAAGGAGFDPSQLGQMFTQLGQMFSGIGAPGAAGSGPVNYDLAARLARQQMGDFRPMLESEERAVADAVRLAELWLDEQTALPSGITVTHAWTPVDWLEQTLPTWRLLCDPIATSLETTWQDGLPEEAKAMAGQMLSMMSGLGGMMFGSQLGQGLGHLSTGVLTSTDIGLPLAPAGTAALLPEAIAKFAEGLDVPGQEIVVFLAAREAAHQRLFAGVGWLRQRLLSSVEDYARGIRLDMSGLEQLGAGVDPQELLSNPAKMEELMSQAAAFEPALSPEQQAALNRLETLLALIEGWVENVVTAALGDRIPSTAALTETMRRRRATGGPAEQTFATLIGLDLRPRKVREAGELWRRLAQAVGESGAAAGNDVRDGVWAHPDLLPDSTDLDEPAAFIDRVIGGGTGAFDDPIAELERTIEEERKARGDDDA
ncbi:zinc-dependent metalloprotease [Gordonia alkaliphila]|uniref:Zinc-dependent metalloprotease n=1 Tax=Gordonia alkaliphila TaxID=1053547 RepID=A0ABP8ZI84_9ACTN|nr:zinc-dependent metalloprotease [Gordonia alkaliphila]MCK0438262.1 zinc-dependent metalloprotease [Gordonia alkaliphila]